MKLKRFVLCFAILAMLVALCACGSSNEQREASTPDIAPGATAKGSESAPSDDGSYGSSLEIGETDPQRKLIYTADYTIETLNFSASIAKIQSLVSEYGGNIEASNIKGRGASINVYDTRTASYTLRIPVENLNAFFSRVGEVGSVLSEQLISEDVTLEYVDNEARLSALRTQESRILAMLDEAKDLQYLLEIERELSDIRYQIESYTTKQNKLDSLISYSTVNVRIDEVYVITEVKVAPRTFGDKLSDTFSESIERVWETLQALAIWLLGNIVEIVLVLAIVAGAVWLLAIIIRRASAKAAKRAAERPAPVCYAPQYIPVMNNPPDSGENK